MAEHNDLGKSGENAAVAYLEQKGYLIRDRNWRRGHFELDIVAAKDNELIAPNLLEKNTGLTEQSWKGDPANKWGTGTSNRQSQSTGRTASQSSVPQRAQVAANAIKGQRNHGSDDQTIFDSLKYQGYTDDEIWKAFELAG